MKEKEVSNLTDEELLEAAKKITSSPIMNAVLIGFMVGIIIYSVAKNTWGLLTVIPLFFIYKLINNSKKDKALEEEIKSRKLK